MSEPNVQEPTMEEILASIRRIISEDEPGEAAPAAEAAAPAPEPEPEAEPEPGPEPFVEAEAEEEVLDLTEPLPEPQAEPEPEPEPVMAVEERFEEPEPVMAAIPDDEPLVGEPAADEAAASFGHLAHSLLMPKAGRTLEDVVREMLNPLLKQWLDEHLPTIVQAKVDEEVERIARRRLR